MRIRQFVASVMAGLLLILGVGVAGATPAQAVYGSTVWFNGIHKDVPFSYDLRTVRTNGTFEYTSWDEKTGNVKYTCPKNENTYLRYTNPLGNTGTLADGECLWPVHEGQYEITVMPRWVR